MLQRIVLGIQQEKLAEKVNKTKMAILISKGKVFITIEEIINYLNGLKQDMLNLKESNIKAVRQGIEEPKLQDLILKIDDDNFRLFVGKLDATIEDLGRHLTHTIIKATKESEQRKKRNKSECFNCHKEYKSKSSLIDLVGLDGIYKRYCDDCCKIQIKDYISKEILQLKKGLKLEDLKHKDLIEISRVCDVVVQNYIFSHPELLKKVMESEPFKKMQEEFGLNKKEETFPEG